MKNTVLLKLKVLVPMYIYMLCKVPTFLFLYICFIFIFLLIVESFSSLKNLYCCNSIPVHVFPSHKVYKSSCNIFYL